MKTSFALPMAMLVFTAGPLRADFASWSFTAQVMLFDDNGGRVPGLQGTTVLTGQIHFDPGVSGVPLSGPVSGLSYTDPQASIVVNVNGVPLSNGSLPVTLSLEVIPASTFSPIPFYAFNMEAQSSPPASFLDISFGMFRQVDPNATQDFSLTNLQLDFNHFDGGSFFYNSNTGPGVPLIGSPDQLLIETQVLSITADAAIQSTPEPASGTLFGLGGIALFGLWLCRGFRARMA